MKIKILLVLISFLFAFGFRPGDLISSSKATCGPLCIGIGILILTGNQKKQGSETSPEKKPVTTYKKYFSSATELGSPKNKCQDYIRDMKNLTFLGDNLVNYSDCENDDYDRHSLASLSFGTGIVKHTDFQRVRKHGNKWKKQYLRGECYDKLRRFQEAKGPNFPLIDATCKVKVDDRDWNILFEAVLPGSMESYIFELPVEAPASRARVRCSETLEYMNKKIEETGTPVLHKECKFEYESGTYKKYSARILMGRMINRIQINSYGVWKDGLDRSLQECKDAKEDFMSKISQNQDVNLISLECVKEVDRQWARYILTGTFANGIKAKSFYSAKEECERYFRNVSPLAKYKYSSCTGSNKKVIAFF